MTWWKASAPFAAISLLLTGSALSQIASDRAAIRAANRARTCFIDMADGQLKCGGRPLRSLAEARQLLTPGALVKPEELRDCKAGEAIWIFKWRGLPTQPPIAVDAKRAEWSSVGSDFDRRRGASGSASLSPDRGVSAQRPAGLPFNSAKSCTPRKPVAALSPTAGLVGGDAGVASVAAGAAEGVADA